MFHFGTYIGGGAGVGLDDLSGVGSGASYRLSVKILVLDPCIKMSIVGCACGRSGTLKD